jgi:hypothetical protein
MHVIVHLKPLEAGTVFKSLNKIVSFAYAWYACAKHGLFASSEVYETEWSEKYLDVRSM